MEREQTEQMAQSQNSEPGTVEQQTYWEQEGKWKQKPRTALLKIIFRRRTFLVVALLIQLSILVATIKWLDDYQFLVFGGFSILGAAVAINIVNSPMNPSQKLTWMIPVLVAPVFGSLLYLYVQADILTKGLAHGIDVRHKESLPYRMDE